MRRILLFSDALVLLVLSLSVLFFTSCQREIDGTGVGSNPGTGTGTDIDAAKVIASIRGTVIDENNQPVQGASVEAGGQTTTTDRYGVFRFNNISLSRNNGFVKVNKQGYFTGSRSFVTTERRTHHVRIRLLRKLNTGNFTASTGGTITLSSGAKLVMPANAVTDAGGNAYSGTVNVAMVWIDPTAADLPVIIPGDLRGITTNGEERVLATYGMLGVEMTTMGGQPLKIASGKTAELTFPVPVTLSASAPVTIDLWHFDETKGRWLQEGTATKNGNNYTAQVSHFSFWNCDVPIPLVDLCMTLVNAANNQPLNNVQVRVVRTNGSYGTGWTDSLGSVCGKVPKNEPLTLQVIDQCNSVAYSQSIGPFGANTSLGTIPVALNATNTLVITGTVTNCANNPLGSGAVIVYTDNANSYSVPVNNGSFSFTLIRCSASTMNFAVKAIDPSTYQESPLLTGSGTNGTVNVGNLQACGTITEFIEYIVDGVPYSWVDIGAPNTIDLYDSTTTSGPYTNKTGIYGQWVVNNNAETTYFWFLNNATTGSFPLDNNWPKINDHAGSLLLRNFLGATPTVNITSYGPVGGYIEGNFTEQMNIGGAAPAHTVICTFKVKR